MRSPWARANAEGTSADAENIAWGYSSPQAAVNGWMNSYGHCLNIMGNHTVAGIGYARIPGSSHLWTAMFR